MSKRIFTFRRGAADRTADAAEALGLKGANLALLASLDVPVPPGFTIATPVWREAQGSEDGLPQALRAELRAAIEWLEGVTGRRFDGDQRPLLLAVRSSARAQMPGLAETVLDIGLNDRTVEILATELKDPAFAYRSYRRFIESYAALVFDVDSSHFEEIADEERDRAGWAVEPEMPADWRALIARYQGHLDSEIGAVLPQTPLEQLFSVVAASYASWRNPLAVSHRLIQGIPENAGLAVTVHAMIFNERNYHSGTGRAVSRDLGSGQSRLSGEFGLGARGSSAIGEKPPVLDLADLANGECRDFPTDLSELTRHVRRIEAHAGDAVEVDFMVGDGELFLMQSRIARRTAPEAIRVAVELVKEGLIEESEAILRIDPASLDQLLHPTIERSADFVVLGRGMPASPGAATGEIVFTSERAQILANEERPVILVRNETHPEDIHGMHVAEGVLTIRGGTTSHAAVVARGIGKPCVTGVGSLRINAQKGTLHAAGRVLREGDRITIDGSTGDVIEGAVPLVRPSLTGDFATLMEFADRARRMRVRANADTPVEARSARSFGAEGIGLCRTEHMFFEGDRVRAMREMILSSDESGRRAALEKLLPIQRSDFIELFEIMAGLPVTIRLLDPPLHEFLPKSDAEITETAAMLGVDETVVKHRIAALEEFNPMLGHRGCRLAISYPEIVETQARAILEAAVEAGEKTGAAVVPEIMVPLVSLRKELDFVKERVDRVAELVMAERGCSINYLVGTMIELPRAIVRADTIAEVAEFFSFGTNDLTQTVYGISRDDAGNFLSTYVRQGIIERDPFQTIDVEGVGELIGLAVEKARRTRPDISLGVCGEQGGDPASIAFFEQTGLDYVSCSPFRVPIARLAAAQSAIRAGRSLRGRGRRQEP
ncbi:pyruvate, phosphate dikinase [Aurantimonas sp. C2-6-R+9]|uniref:pyruvate, phosphate dikinase n=1 Tax=unclassified Aurantimonas TaxID=2638230 RepID=UPI002E18016A|nr:MULTISPECIES: pyruvate, phosphate dikinase [unclassified Aurantimonas]MEC5289139.1 pyruvate, phosphate dikinase [Aurantimonas sp. C2-3-R2]MEC5379286.1 pyruvate, phosphate dikinase [Aurantimonas sp. C2-6-R+9]MEC5410039.1 pyruvate, phosphate dikinase [Aurantimonas sp. C2-4-R8]